MVLPGAMSSFQKLGVFFLLQDGLDTSRSHELKCSYVSGSISTPCILLSDWQRNKDTTDYKRNDMYNVSVPVLLFWRSWWSCWRAQWPCRSRCWEGKAFWWLDTCSRRSVKVLTPVGWTRTVALVFTVTSSRFFKPYKASSFKKLM